MTTTSDTKMDATADGSRETGPWNEALAILREWDPEWAETCAKMTTNPWSSTVLPRKTVELIGVRLTLLAPTSIPTGHAVTYAQRSEREPAVKTY